MQKRNWTLSTLVPLAGAAMGQAINYVEIEGSQEFSGEMIVRPIQLKDWMGGGAGAADANANIGTARALMAGFEVIEHVPQTDEYIIVVPKGRTENELANELMATGNFQYAEPNWTLYPIGCPDDSRLGQQWHHNANRMQSCDAWDIATGNPSVSVGICDTGIRTSHEDFQQHRLEGYNAVDRQWENQGGDISNVHPHGTMTTGCAAANGNNGVGVSGVGWNLSHRMLRVSNSSGGGASLNNLQHAARTAVENGDRVASVSYSGVDSGSNLTTATYIKSIGGLLVWSAGNDGRNLNLGPRDADDIIVTGATNSGDNKSGFSAFGPFVDLTAPGEGVFTTDADSNSDYASVSGTSFSCPLTAGLIAMIWSANPSLTPDEVEQVLKEGCDDLGNAGVDNTYGYGRINTFNSLSLAFNPIEFTFPDGLAELIDPNGGTTIRVEVAARDDTPVPGTGTLSYDDGSGFVTINMEVVSNTVYDAVFPGFDCADDVQYYFSVDTTGGDTASEPRGAPNNAFGAPAIVGIDTIVRDNFESTGGWTTENINVEDGQWDRGVPVGGGDRGDPAQDFDGSGSAWLTDNVDGNSDVDGGPTRLISPAFDLAGMDGLILSYARWFTNDDGDGDRLVVEVSNNNGGNWTMLESVGNRAGWMVAEFVLENHIALSSQMRFRFSATDNPSNSVTEAGLDDFRLFMIDCGDGGCAADLDGDGDADADDFFAYLDLFAADDPDADIDVDGDTDADDFFAYLDLFALGC